MRGERERHSNRANAKASTGPRTAAGKSRAARNAFRHGLNIAVLYDAALAPSIEALARSIAGDTADPPLLDLARQIAEAQVELQRARAHKQRLIASAYADPAYEPRETAFRQLTKARTVLKLVGMNGQPSPDVLPFLERQSLQGPEKMAAILDDLTPELILLDRYERRALSRRKFAILKFEAHCFVS